MIIDDEELLARALQRALGGQFDLFWVSNGLEALQVVIGGARFAAILCDLRMPIMTGPQLHRELEQIAPDQADRMVFMGAELQKTGALKFIEQAGNPVLEKPLDIRMLQNLLCTVVATRRAA